MVVTEMQILCDLGCDSLQSHITVSQLTLHRNPVNYSTCAFAMLTSQHIQEYVIPMFCHKTLKYSGKQKLQSQY